MAAMKSLIIYSSLILILFHQISCYRCNVNAIQLIIQDGRHEPNEFITYKDTLSPFKHCRVTLKNLPERQFRLNKTSNHFIQGEGGGRGRGRPLAVGMNQHTA